MIKLFFYRLGAIVFSLIRRQPPMQMMQAHENKLYKLNPDTIKTLDDVKKVLAGMDIMVHAASPTYKDIKDYFTIEFVPPRAPMPDSMPLPNIPR